MALFNINPDSKKLISLTEIYSELIDFMMRRPKYF
jgi:hypothetical protein